MKSVNENLKATKSKTLAVIFTVLFYVVAIAFMGIMLTGCSKEIKITYELNNEDVVLTYKDSVIIGTIDSPQRVGYTFAGWYKDVNYTSAYSNSEKITSDKTIYAKWTANTYSVVYNANGGSGTIEASTNILFNSQYTIKESTGLTKEHYIFNGWNTASDGSGTSYTAGATIPFKVQGLTLYAQWKGVGQTVTINLDGFDDALKNSLKTSFGIKSDANTITIPYGEKLTLPVVESTVTDAVNPSKKFSGWNVGGVTYGSGASVTVTDAVTVQAIWATGVSISLNKNVDKGFTDADRTEINNTTLVTTIFTPTGVDPDTGKYIVYLTDDGTENGNFITLSNLTNYKFNGWALAQNSNAPDCSATKKYILTDVSVPVYAVWVVETKTVVHYTDIASTAFEADPVAYEGSVLLSNLSDGNANYNFKGWSLTKNSTTAEYPVVENSKQISITINMDKTHQENDLTIKLYPVWERIQVNIAVSNNGGEGNSRSYAIDKGGYTFTEAQINEIKGSF